MLGGHPDPVPALSHRTRAGAGAPGRSLAWCRQQEKPGWAVPRLLLQLLERPEGFQVAEGSAEAVGERVAGQGQRCQHSPTGSSGPEGLSHGVGTWPGAAPHPKLTPSWAAAASASSAALGCCSQERGLSSAPASPEELDSRSSLLAGSGGAAGLWGCDPSPVPALGTPGAHGSTWGNVTESSEGTKGLRTGLCLPPRSALGWEWKISIGEAVCCWWEHLGSLELTPCHSPAIPYLQVLLDPGRALLRRGWICSQSTGILMLAAHRGLPGFQLHLGTGNGVRTRLSREKSWAWGGQGAKTQRKSRRRAWKNPTPGRETARWRGRGLEEREEREEGEVTAAKETPEPGSSGGGSIPGSGGISYRCHSTGTGSRALRRAPSRTGGLQAFPRRQSFHWHILEGGNHDNRARLGVSARLAWDGGDG